jgi:cyanate lyase
MIFADNIFLAVAEGLSRAILEAKRTRGLSWVKLGRNFSSSHLFVDDVLLFSDGSSRDARKLNEILELYSKATSMEINIHISCICFNVLTEKLKR